MLVNKGRWNNHLNSVESLSFHSVSGSPKWGRRGSVNEMELPWADVLAVCLLVSGGAPKQQSSYSSSQIQPKTENGVNTETAMERTLVD